jgi:hypothetical protein
MIVNSTDEMQTHQAPMYEDIVEHIDDVHEHAVTYAFAGPLADADAKYLDALEHNVKSSANHSIRQIELIPGAHMSVGGDRPRWAGVVVTLKNTTLLKDVWRDDMFGCEALYRIPIDGSGEVTADVLRHTAVGVINSPIVIEADSRMTSHTTPLAKPLAARVTGKTLRNVGTVLDYLNNAGRLGELIDGAAVDDFSKDLGRLTELASKFSSKQTISDEHLVDMINKTYTPAQTTASMHKKAPLGPLKCSVNIYQSTDPNAPNQPSLWLMVRTYDPVVNAAIAQRYGSLTLAECLQKPLVARAEQNALKCCDAIAHSLLLTIVTAIPNTIDYSDTTGDVTVESPFKASPSIARHRVCAYHYNVFAKHTDVCTNGDALDGEYVFYGACLRTHGTTSTSVPLGLGRQHGLLLYVGNRPARVSQCKGAFPLGVEPARESITVLCDTVDALRKLNMQQLTPTRERIEWTNSKTVFVRHPKVLCAAETNATISHLESRIKAVDYLSTSFATQRLRLWPVRSYISAPLASFMNVYELLVFSATKSVIKFGHQHVQELMELTAKTGNSVDFTFQRGVGEITYDNLKKLLISE